MHKSGADGTRGRGRHRQARKLPCGGRRSGCVADTAIGNAVANLENWLGIRLFNRTTRNVALTTAGREYVEAIAPALSDIRNAAQAVADRQPQADRYAAVQLLNRRGTPATDALRLRVAFVAIAR